METDVLIIGCGIAGATAALQLSRDGQRQITVLTRDESVDDSNSRYAQGGIVARGRDDSADLLIQDVLAAGAGLANPPAVRILATEGPDRLQEILVEDAGVNFDRDEGGDLAYGLEAAHSRRRILHVGDRTGETIMEALRRRLAGHSNITLLNGHTAVDLLTYPHHSQDPLAVYQPSTCHGAYALKHATRAVEPIVARQTILATGGLGQIYLNTTNPPGSRGDGLAMAYRAGARVVNAEYVQFHPTALSMAGTTKMLISEAVRGEGGVLLTPAGERFMERYAPGEKDLATRDVVARAIYKEMIDNDYPHVLLDIASHKPAEEIRQRFPGIHAHCLKHNIDITCQPIPVVPAAHYFCGGLLVDLDGRTSLPGLYAVGEVACTGVHGANRLASTSLLEGLVWADRAARDISERDEGPLISRAEVPPWHETGFREEADHALIQGDLHNIRSLMWHYVGLMRNGDRLGRAVRELRRLWLSIEDFYRRAHLTDGLIGLRNSVLNAVIVSRAALLNPTSRGNHFREDSQQSVGARSPGGSHPMEPTGSI
jgi:L-aspartate oxidase